MNYNIQEDDGSRVARGIACPKCSSPLSDVIRTTRGVDKMRRRRKCAKCGHEWGTKEETEVKNDT